jgi:hypothetical protein
LVVLPLHRSWLTYAQHRYGFGDLSEVVRHLIFVANGEVPANKRLIFKIKRCLHCAVGQPKGSSAKVPLLPDSEPVLAYEFQRLWLQDVIAKCAIPDLGKCMRIICDYYQSRIAAASRSPSPDVPPEVVERDLFLMNRLHDSRASLAMTCYDQRLRGVDPSAEIVQILADDVQSDPAACSPTATWEATRRCQVGRGSASFAVAVGETAEETRSRREREELLENSEESKLMRDLIASTLGAVMGKANSHAKEQPPTGAANGEEERDANAAATTTGQKTKW